MVLEDDAMLNEYDTFLDLEQLQKWNKLLAKLLNNAVFGRFVLCTQDNPS